MMKRVLFVALLCGAALLWAQEEPAPAAEPAAEITAAEIRDNASRTLPEAMNGVPGLFFREAGAGISYPVLRGMPSEAVPVIFDGIALGGTVFTGGTGTWLSLLDRRLAERIIVKNGPDTVDASSTAAGGSVTIEPFTTAPVRGKPEFAVGGRFNTRFSSADTNRDAHARIAAGYGNFGALAAGSVAFSDARMNGARQDEPFSSFENYGAFFAGDWAFTRDTGSSWHLSVGYIYAGMSDAADTGAISLPDGTPDTVQLYERAAHVAWGRLGLRLPASDLTGTFTLSYQNAVERTDTSFLADGRSIWRAQRRDETTGHTAGIAVDFVAGMVPELFSLRYGGTYYHDFIGTSHSERTDAAAPLTGTGIAALPDDSASDRFAGYVSGDLALIKGNGPHRLTATAGYRFEGATLRAPQREDIPAINFTEPGHAVDASIAYGWRENLDLALTYGHGTRAPTLREAVYYGIRNGRFFVPNGGLEAETTDTLDLTLRGRTKRISASLSGFATHINDRIGRVAAQWRGAPEREGLPVAGYANTGRALIWGIMTAEKLSLPFGFTLNAGAAYLWGEERLKNDRIAPIDHIAPILWNAALRWDSSEPGDYQGFAEIAVRAATDPGTKKKEIAQTAAIDSDSWQMLSLRGGFVFDEYIRVFLTIENLLDRNYRPFQAGINGAGINGILSLDAEF